MEKLSNIHPGEILLEEFMTPMEITAYKLSKDIHIPQTRISQILKGKRRITADTALRLSLYFGNSAKFWLGLQDDFDLETENQINEESFKQIRLFRKENTQLPDNEMKAS
ncbi:MAG: HigA family addiction module antitoxin [Bacteroidota bacterium]|nr:HigA family addiction module antitoxin [Bacteroidota bacterium]